VNRLKANYNPQTLKPKVKQKPTRKPPKNPTSRLKEDEEEDEVLVGKFSLGTEFQLQNITSQRKTLDPLKQNTQTLNTPELNSQNLDTPEPNLETLDTLESNSQILDTPISEHTDPNYEPPETPKSRRELQPTRAEPSLTRSRARVVSQESINEQTDAKQINYKLLETNKMLED